MTILFDQFNDVSSFQAGSNFSNTDYADSEGHNSGIFDIWETYKKATHGFYGFVYKSLLPKGKLKHCQDSTKLKRLKMTGKQARVNQRYRSRQQNIIQ